MLTVQYLMFYVLFMLYICLSLDALYLKKKKKAKKKKKKAFKVKSDNFRYFNWF